MSMATPMHILVQCFMSKGAAAWLSEPRRGLRWPDVSEGGGLGSVKGLDQVTPLQMLADPYACFPTFRVALLMTHSVPVALELVEG
jgi:hypothetical protein